MKPVQSKPKATPIYQTSVFSFEDLNELEAYFEAPANRYMYSRYGNPNSDELAQEVAQLEKAQDAVVTSSGTSAILTSVLTFCRSGDHLLCSEEIYGGSAVLLQEELSRLGIEVTFVKKEDTYSFEDYCTPQTKMFLTETMTNPLLTVHDIRRLARECHQAGLKLVIDNTFATPVITTPLTLGADLVLHSVTKYLSGHSDVTAGVIAGSNQVIKRVREIVIRYGLNLSPFDSWLASRGVKTLRLRMKQHSENAMKIAETLSNHHKVKHVYYPGLRTHPDYTLAKQQGHDLFGGMLSFQIEDDRDKVNTLFQQLEHIVFAPSLAGVQTSISHPLSTSHRSIDPEQCQKLNITEGLIRLSVGIEEYDVLEQELLHALNQL
ncbi:trans-sulfuration enzyme family protein [Caldalkalibacillus salinus]|uniref:trans-sulfuration enzyme family protein n=1 Tax=Caldalkalibacillus salinus TaxID=2803787 RepID=UPI0019212993|nr:aminotransferase class I/II-fold pyridoxal phosphate-dependent enzyme [Caldalkalibacillus salinus]